MTAKQTPLYQLHCDLGAQMVDFAGWQMPLHYGSQLNEHRVVREQFGMFDVSHMTVVDLRGTEALAFLRYLLANDVSKLKEQGDALYSCMLNEKGGVIDDLIVYRQNQTAYRLVVNAATRDNDLKWIEQQAKAFDVSVQERDELSMLAIQGPDIRETIPKVFGDSAAADILKLKPFKALSHEDSWIARTGYTGEDGFEIILPGEKAQQLWKELLALGVHPCGLGARDTLRLEAGLNLYGTDMDETITPLEANLAWTVAWEPADRDFIGREALTQQKANGINYKMVGLVMDDPGMLRNHQSVSVDSDKEGVITSGSFSPTMGCAIALARLPADMSNGVSIERRGKTINLRVVKPPFVRNGKKLV